MTSECLRAAIDAIRAGKPVILPTDTVYGLCVTPYRAEPVECLYRLKRREAQQPTALLASDLDALFECVPELRGRAATAARALLPGPYTLVLPNPARHFRWLTGTTPEAIGVRVPELPEPSGGVLGEVGAVEATCANLPGGPDPHRIDEVPAALRDGAAALIDGGELPGVPSTVLDLTGLQPRVLREGAVPAAVALAQVESALS